MTDWLLDMSKVRNARIQNPAGDFNGDGRDGRGGRGYHFSHSDGKAILAALQSTETERRVM
jgi:hypothetical protein